MEDNTTFYFNLICKNKIKNYKVNSNIYLKNFIEKLRPIAKKDFHLNEKEYIEIVEMKKQPNTNKWTKVPLLPFKIRIKEFYTSNKRYHFYIRKPPHIVIDILEQHIEDNTHDEKNNFYTQKYIGDENV